MIMEEWEKWDDVKICKELVNKLNEIKEGYIITEEEKEKMLEELKRIWEEESYGDYLRKVYGDIQNEITQEENKEQIKIYNDTQCIFHFFNMDMSDEEILEKWGSEEVEEYDD